MQQIYVASSNQGKLADFAQAADAHGIRVFPIPRMDQVTAPDETGSTFEENAVIKAEFYSQYVPGEILIADDSGLAVDALRGMPGVRSARYAADSGIADLHPDEANNQLLLRRTESIPDARRHCAFICSIAAARDGKTLQTFSAQASGMLLRAPRGNHGFGYDPLFYFPELKRSFAELSREEKLRVSHRGKAFGEFLAWMDRANKRC